MTTILNGLVGGLIATIVMSAFMMTFGDDSPPPTAAFWSKYVGDGSPENYRKHGVVLHLVYGVVAGAGFVSLAAAFSLGVASYGAAFSGDWPTAARCSSSGRSSG